MNLKGIDVPNFEDKLEVIYNDWMNETRGFSTRREYFEFCFDRRELLNVEGWLKAAMLEGYDIGFQDGKNSDRDSYDILVNDLYSTISKQHEDINSLTTRCESLKSMLLKIAKQQHENSKMFDTFL